jgi:hypothetical protein
MQNLPLQGELFNPSLAHRNSIDLRPVVRRQSLLHRLVVITGRRQRMEDAVLPW